MEKDMEKEKDWIASAKEKAKEIYLAHESSGPQGTPDDLGKLAVCVIDLCDEIAELKKKLAR